MKKISPIIIFILVFIGMEAFPYVPIRIFNLDINSFTPFMKIMYVLASDIGYMTILFFLYRKDIIKDFKKYCKNFIDNFKDTFPYYVMGLAGMIFSNYIINILFSSATAGNEEAVRTMIDKYPLYMLFSVAIYAPFVEEIIFRKSLKDIFRDLGNNKIYRYGFIVLSGFIFSLMHVIGNSTSFIDYIFIISYIPLGIAFAYTYDKTDNIFSSIMLHSFHNLVAVILYFIIGGL